MDGRKLYYIFFPDKEDVPFRRLRWIVLILIQELAKKKFKAVFKYFYKKSYRIDINYLSNLLSKKRYKGAKVEIPLYELNFSHEINYPKWIEKLERDLIKDPDNYQRIKVFNDNGKWLVIDGNHRLYALQSILGKSENNPSPFIKCLMLY